MASCLAAVHLALLCTTALTNLKAAYFRPLLHTCRPGLTTDCTEPLRRGTQHPRQISRLCPRQIACRTMSCRHECAASSRVASPRRRHRPQHWTSQLCQLTQQMALPAQVPSLSAAMFTALLAWSALTSASVGLQNPGVCAVSSQALRHDHICNHLNFGVMQRCVLAPCPVRFSEVLNACRYTSSPYCHNDLALCR